MNNLIRQEDRDFLYRHFDISGLGSIVIMRPLTQYALDWWRQNVDSMDWGPFAVEPRYVEAIVYGFLGFDED